MINVRITREKVDPKHLYKGAKGTYLDLMLIPNKQGTDQYGNDGMVVQRVSKENHAKGIKGPILGNYRNLTSNNNHSQPQEQAPVNTATTATDATDDVPF